MSTILDALPRLDWGDFQRTASLTQDALARLVETPGELQKLLYAVERSPELLGMSERLKLDDKIVLYEALEDRGFRLRLHVSKNLEREVPHDHRFDITVRILSGAYYHKLYVRGSNGNEDAPVFIRDERAGASYTMHHTLVESNTTAPGTMSLLLRGPTMKAKAKAVDRATGAVWHKLGQKDESEEHKENVAMSLKAYRALRGQVESLMGWQPLSLASGATV